MIRKVIHIILAFLLLATTSGMTVYAHFCGSNLESIRIEKDSHLCCGDDCGDCRDENVTVILEEVFFASNFSFEFHDFGTALHAIQPLNLVLLENPNLPLAYVKDYPPPLIKTALPSLQTYRL